MFFFRIKKNVKSSLNHIKTKKCSIVLKKLDTSLYYKKLKNIPTFSCKHCLKVFEYKNELNRHKCIYKQKRKTDRKRSNNENSEVNKRNENNINTTDKRNNGTIKKDEKVKDSRSNKNGDKKGRIKKINEGQEITNNHKLKPDKNNVTNEEISNHYKCESCNMDLQSLDDVRNHPKNDCKYKCKICVRFFNTINGFIVHILQHKMNSSKLVKVENQLTCKDCNLSFIDLIKLKSHSILAHKYAALNQNKDIENNEEDLSCELCFDVFDSKRELEQHMELHKEFSSANVLDDVYDISD